MNFKDACYHAVHEYPGGAASLAPRMGLAVSTLQNMASPSQEAHGWNVARLRQLLAFTRDMRPLDALCEEAGGVFVPCAIFAGVSDVALLETVTHMCKEFGDVSGALNEAMADGNITEREFDTIKQQVYELNQATCEFLNRVAQLVKKEKSPHANQPGNAGDGA